MTPADLEKELKAGKVRPVYVLAGEERYLSDQAARLLRKQLVDPAMADFNEDALTVGDSGVTAERILAAARTAPMMADRRFVLVRGIERWEGRGDAGKDDDKKKEGPLDLLARYAEAPVDSACLVLMAGKLDSRRRLAALAKKQNFLVSCEPLDRRALKGWIEREFKARGHALEAGVGEHLAEIAGPELGHVADAVERLALYVGAGQKITADAVAQVVTRVRETDVWELSTAVGARDLSHALAVLDQVYAPREGIALLAMLASSIRKLLRFALAVEGGASPEDAARTAGVPPFKVREAAAQARAMSTAELERWLFVLAEADGALKGSRRPERTILDGLLLDLVGRRPPADAPRTAP